MGQFSSSQIKKPCSVIEQYCEKDFSTKVKYSFSGIPFDLIQNVVFHGSTCFGSDTFIDSLADTEKG